MTGVQAFGMFVELDEIYVQGLVHVSSMTDDYYRFNEKTHSLTGENTRQDEFDEFLLTEENLIEGGAK